MTGLLRVLELHPGPVEADLQRYYQIDLTDRWRGRLSLRRILLMIRHLPDESATRTTIRGGAPVWSTGDHLLDELRMQVAALGGVKKPQPHPNRPRPKKRAGNTPKRRAALAAARRRAVQRRRAIEAGQIE